MNFEPCESCSSSSYENILDNLVHEYYENGKLSKWNYSLLKCKTCGMGVISPKPTWDILQTFYDNNYGCYDAEIVNPINESMSFKYKIAKLRYASVLENGINQVIASAIGITVEVLSGRVVSYSLGIPLQLPKYARILDFGYGGGNWLKSMAYLGYQNLCGYDIDANTEHKNKLESIGITINNGDFLKVGYPDNYFDCIRLEHVFEPLLEPKAILKELYRILKPGGLLVMNFPSINAMSFSLSPTHCVHRDSPRQLYLHTAISAHNIITNAGFKIKNLRQYAVAPVLEETINNMLKANNILLTLSRFSLIAPLYSLVNISLRLGEFITVLALK